MSPRVVLRGGCVVAGTAAASRDADVVMFGGRIVAVGDVACEPGDEVVDCTGRMLLPGLIDAHSHADAAVFDERVQRALLRQGVTTVVAGQDGISFAPGDGRYAAEYFAGLNGRHPHWEGGGIADLLRGYDGTTPVNVGYLVPAGTVRHEVMGMAAGPSDQEQLARMMALVRDGLTQGALGMSSGLDYVPGCHATTEELISLCVPVAAAGGLYVTHMRGGYEEAAGVGVDEVARICEATGVAAHVSHLHARADLVRELFADLAERGLDVTYDAYPYTRGCTLLAMPLLPPDLLENGPRVAAGLLASVTVRERVLREWIPSVALRPDMGPEWPVNATIAHVASDEYTWTEGMTLQDAAARVGRDPAEFGLTLLAASQLDVTAVFAVPVQRSDDDLAALFTHPAHVGGSDGIFVGRHPHPRAYGCFARFLGVFARQRGDYSWTEAAQHLSGRTAERYGLADRGRVAPGFRADVVVVDPASVADRATYDAPVALATGVDDVFVGGVAVLRDGDLTGAKPGRGLRSSAPAR